MTRCKLLRLNLLLSIRTVQLLWRRRSLSCRPCLIRIGMSLTGHLKLQRFLDSSSRMKCNEMASKPRKPDILVTWLRACGPVLNYYQTSFSRPMVKGGDNSSCLYPRRARYRIAINMFMRVGGRTLITPTIRVDLPKGQVLQGTAQNRGQISLARTSPSE